jgi:hypothetical protein
MLDRMPPDYALRHDVIVRSLLQAIEHGNKPLFLQLLDRGAVEGVDVNTVAIIPAQQGLDHNGVRSQYDHNGDFWRRKDYDFFVSKQGGKPLSLVCATAMEFEIFQYLSEHPDTQASKPSIPSVLGETVSHLYHGGEMWGQYHTPVCGTRLASESMLTERLDQHYTQGRVRKQQNRSNFLNYFNGGGGQHGQLHSVPDILTVFGKLGSGLGSWRMFKRDNKDNKEESHKPHVGDHDVGYPDGFATLVVDALHIDLLDNSVLLDWYCEVELRGVKTRQEQEMQLCNGVEKGVSVVELEKHLVKEFDNASTMFNTEEIIKR